MKDHRRETEDMSLVVERKHADIPSELAGKMHDLILVGKKNGKVLPVSEAFTMYPPEDEAHQGKLDYWLGEKCD